MDVRTLPAGHPARRPVAVALWSALGTAGVFVVFAFLTTQVRAVRAGSPWQDDPYDAVVSGTMFFVPVLAAAMLARMALCRAARPLPLFRVRQLLRAALAGTLLVAVTVLADWIAVLARADHRLWNAGTPWLAGALAPLTMLVAVALVLYGRAARVVPGDGGRPDGDWLDDLLLIVGALAARGPRAVRAFPAGPAIAFVRRHFVALAAAASFVVGLGMITVLAVGEGGFALPLFALLTTVSTGAWFAFTMICDRVLRLTVRPAGRPWRRAVRVSVTAAAAALYAATGLRDLLWPATGRTGGPHTVGDLAALVFACAALTAALAFALTLAGPLLRRPPVPGP